MDSVSALVTKLLLCNGIVLEAPAFRASYRAAQPSPSWNPRSQVILGNALTERSFTSQAGVSAGPLPSWNSPDALPHSLVTFALNGSQPLNYEIRRISVLPALCHINISSRCPG